MSTQTMASFFFLGDNAVQIFEAGIGGKIEAELRELYRNFRPQAGVMDAAQDLGVVFGDLQRFGAIPDVFAEIGENAGDFLLFQAACRLHGGVDAFAGHEARDTSPHKRIIDGVFAQPGVLGSGKQDRPHQRHICEALLDGVMEPPWLAVLF